jgi:hypothetical protein
MTQEGPCPSRVDDATRNQAHRCPSRHAKLREQAEELIAAYIEPGSDRPAIINHLIQLFDGPAQAERLTRKALADGEKWQIRLQRHHHEPASRLRPDTTGDGTADVDKTRADRSK